MGLDQCELNWHVLDVLYYIKEEAGEKEKDPMTVIQDLVDQISSEQAKFFRDTLHK